MKQKLWKIRYYIKRLFGMEWKTFFESVSLAKERSRKPWIVMFFDIIISSFRYNAGYNDYIEFEFYLMNHAQRQSYLTAPKSMAIARQYNDRERAGIILDKSQFHKYYGKFVSRAFLDLTEASLSEFTDFIKTHKNVMCKVVDGNSGVGITKVEYSEALDIQALYDQCLNQKQTLIEEYFVQHPKMAELSASSVNTIRMVTFVDKQGVPHIITLALKIGVGGYVDNIGQGGMYTILSEDGEVVVPFINQKGDHFSVHPLTKMNLIGFTVPNFEVIKQQILEVALVIPEVRYVGWDISVNVSGNLEIIEGNPFTGTFQLPASLALNKMGVMPVLSQYLD